jgi:hypothetical protein
MKGLQHEMRGVHFIGGISSQKTAPAEERRYARENGVKA